MTGIPSPSDVPATHRVDVDDSGRARVLWLRTADACAGVVPALGGRVLSLATKAGEHIFRNPELLDNAIHPAVEIAEVSEEPNGALGRWLNWGGDKTWPAPQGWSGPSEWPGPPDTVLDGGPYIASWTVDHARASIEMRSPDDPRTGLRIRRRAEVTEGTSGYRLTSTFTNTSDREIRWAIWQVVLRVTGKIELSPLVLSPSRSWIQQASCSVRSPLGRSLPGLTSKSACQPTCRPRRHRPSCALEAQSSATHRLVASTGREEEHDRPS
jgi:hypothetical protein